jgi:hypothetical protein
LVHLVSRKNSQFKQLRAGIDQLGDTLPRRQPAFFMLRFNGFRASALSNLFFFVLNFREEINDAAVIFLEVG